MNIADRRTDRGREDAGLRFERAEGRPLVPLPAFRLDDRVVEMLVPGDADTWVVIPALQEAPSIAEALDAIAAQTLRPLVLCVVDNGSTDGTPDVVRAWAAAAGPAPAGRGSAPAAISAIGVRLAFEPEKGTGAAADTGMRFAIAAGAAYLLRTDADSRPREDWAARMRSRLSGGVDLVAGRLVDRPDEHLSVRRRLALRALMTGAAIVSVPKNRGPGYRTRFRMLVGSNVGIRAATYEAAGGFPRSSIEELHDDRALMNRVRRITDRIASDRHAVVRSSARRYARYGLRGVIAWYLDHDSRGAPIDVR